MQILRFAIAILITMASSFLKAGLDDYLYKHNDVPTYNNYGGLGLIQMPNARFHPEGTLALSWSHNEPYINGSVIAYPFSWL